MGGVKVKIVKWNFTGNILGIAFENGNLGIVDIESAIFTPSRQGSSQKHRISDLNWTSFGQPNEMMTLMASSLQQGGMNLVKRCGLIEFPDSNNDASKASTSSSTNGTAIAESTDVPLLMLSISTEFHVLGHLFGVYPIFSIQLPSISSITMPSISGRFIKSTGQLFIRHIDINNNKQQEISRQKAIHVCYHCDYFNVNRFQQFQHQSKLILNVENILSKTYDAVLSFGKKWKEATKVILPKIQLLQGIIDGYQLELNPIEFMFTVAQCGLWHPSASASFPNHWNEQGINRLRSSIDNTLLSIIKYLTMTTIPLITNVILHCTEIISTSEWIQNPSIHDTDDNGIKQDPSFALFKDEIYYLSLLSHSLLRKIDEVVLEARLTQQNMTTFIQVGNYSCLCLYSCLMLISCCSLFVNFLKNHHRQPRLLLFLI